MMDVTITLTERHPLVRLDRVVMQLNLEKLLSEKRGDKDWMDACEAGRRRIFGLKSILVRCSNSQMIRAVAMIEARAGGYTPKK